jgi:hypothetical protein
LRAFRTARHIVDLQVGSRPCVVAKISQVSTAWAGRKCIHVRAKIHPHAGPALQTATTSFVAPLLPWSTVGSLLRSKMWMIPTGSGFGFEAGQVHISQLFAEEL